MDNELEIINRIQNGEIDQFGILYNYYFDKIYRFILMKSHSKLDAQDITSDVFFRVCKNINSFKTRKGATFSSWVYRIAYNQVVTYYRKKKNIVTLNENKATICSDFIANIEAKDEIEKILNYLDTLGNVTKNIFIMRMWDNISYDEISIIVGKSVSACKTIQSRTLKKIVARFGNNTKALILLATILGNLK